MFVGLGNQSGGVATHQSLGVRQVWIERRLVALYTKSLLALVIRLSVWVIDISLR